MACTVAVEDTIVTHYTDQIREIIDQGKEEDYKELLQVYFKTSYYGADQIVHRIYHLFGTTICYMSVSLFQCFNRLN